jgi:hypothetical protein
MCSNSAKAVWIAAGLVLAMCGCTSGSADACRHEVSSAVYKQPGPPLEKTMAVDRNAKTVTITYDKDGHHVVEHWRIASSN